MRVPPTRSEIFVVLTLDLYMDIREYTAEDWPRLCEIHDAARLDELRLSVGEAAFLTLEQTAKNEGLFDASVFVAEVSGRVEGFVAFSQDELTWLYVHPSSYRHGIGRALLRHAIEHAGNHVSAEVLEGNEPALQLYLSEGFSIVKKAKGRLVGNEAFEASGYILERRKNEPTGVKRLKLCKFVVSTLVLPRSIE